MVPIQGFDVATADACQHLARPYPTHLQLAFGKRRRPFPLEGGERVKQWPREPALIEKGAAADELHHVSVGCRGGERGGMDERVEVRSLPEARVTRGLKDVGKTR